MSDAGNLFNATAVTTAGGHANQAGTAAAITVASISAGRTAMRVQKSLDGIPLNIGPAMIVAGPQKQTELEQLLSTQLLATQISNINPFNGGGLTSLKPVIDAYITDNAWYLFADPMVAPTFVWGYVSGFEGPRFAIDQPFRQDGLSLKVVEDFGFDACVDYKAYRLQADLAAATPDGIDGYFENVGGAVLDAVLARMNAFGRIAVCGLIAGYNDEPIPVNEFRSVLSNRLKIQGFIVSEVPDAWPPALAELAARVADGSLKYKETVARGIASAPAAFIGLLRGENLGKQLVSLD
jgi:hypothetical protein